MPILLLLLVGERAGQRGLHAFDVDLVRRAPRKLRHEVGEDSA